MNIEPNTNDTALVLTDPQNDFLSPDGVTWELVGESVEENQTVEHIEQLLKAAKDKGYEVFVSPHYYYPTDSGWKFGGAVEKLMHEIGMFERKGALTLDGFEGSGADFLEHLRLLVFGSRDLDEAVLDLARAVDEAHLRIGGNDLGIRQ